MTYDGTTTVTPVALEGLPSSGPFFLGAACAGDTGFDWTPDLEPVTVPPEQAALCAGCPAREQCLQWALDHDAAGIYAATTKRQRREFGQERPEPLHDGPGSSTWYRKGCPCDSCRAAQTQRMREFRAARKNGGVR